jgi:NADP-dependent 3-hydroxy acid dehydrogenase YdfG
MQKTIFIKGVSKGFEKLCTKAFFKRGYKVAATSRNEDVLKDFAVRYG